MSTRGRYTVTFAGSELWKGPGERSIVVHVLDPGTDCVVAWFAFGKEYVVPAIEQPAKDYRLGSDFCYGWLDVLPADATILTVNYCDSTGEISKSRGTLAKLGRRKACIDSARPYYA